MSASAEHVEHEVASTGAASRRSVRISNRCVAADASKVSPRLGVAGSLGDVARMYLRWLSKAS